MRNKRQGGGHKRALNVVLENKLYEWFREKRSKHAAVNDFMLKRRAKAIANSPTFHASNGWLWRLKDRWKIRSRIATKQKAAGLMANRKSLKTVAS